jgi:hypothetical protein
MADRNQEYDERIVGRVGPRESNLAYDRQRLIDSIGTASRQAVESFNKEKEASELAEAARTAVAGTAVMEISGLGLGALVTAFATSVLWDVTGILAGVAFMALGLLILPARRRKANQELEQKLSALRQRLMANLTDQFHRELRRSTQRVMDTVAPFARFVRAEQGKFEEQRGTLNELNEELAALRAQLQPLPAGPNGQA